MIPPIKWSYSTSIKVIWAGTIWCVLTNVFAVDKKTQGSSSTNSNTDKIAASNYAALLAPMNLYAPPANAKKLISLKELYALINTRGVAVKVARDDFATAKQDFKTQTDTKLPVLSLDLGNSNTWTKTKTDENATDNYIDRNGETDSRSVAANGGFSLAGTPMQGVTYKLLFPQLVHSQTMPSTSTQEPIRQDNAAFTASLGISLLKDNPFKAEPLSKKKQNLAFSSSRETLKQQLISTIAAAESVFYGLAQKHLQLSVQERSFNLAKALEKDVKEKIAAGESSQLEATRAELQSAQSEVDYMSSQIDYEAALQEFKRSLAYDNAEGDGVFPDPKALDFNIEEFKIPLDAEKEIRKSNPTIQLTHIAKQIAEADMELSRNATLPTLGFATSYGNASPSETPINATTESLRPNDRTFSVALTYTQILYNNTSRNAFEKAILSKQKAELTIDDTERKVMRDYDSLRKRLDIGSRRHRIAKLSREIAEKKLNSEYEKFKAGESSVRNVIDTQTEVNSARISEISARVDLLLGYGQLNALQGRLPEGVTLGNAN